VRLSLVPSALGRRLSYGCPYPDRTPPGAPVHHKLNLTFT
jgi:hypothetical protein